MVELFCLILVAMFAIILSLLPEYIAIPLAFVLAVGGPLALGWRYKRIRDKLMKESRNPGDGEITALRSLYEDLKKHWGTDNDCNYN